MFLKLAWRNLWRNKRRTYITLASVFFAVILSTFMMSMKEGMYVKMVDSMVGAFTGHAQVHAEGYWNEKTLDNALVMNDTLHQKLSTANALNGYAARIETFALAASDEITRGSMVVGVEPAAERTYNSLHERVVEGTYFSANDRGVMVGAQLAEYLKIGVGDTLVLLGQGYHGVSASGKYPVQAIVKFGSPELSKQLVFLPLKEAQWLYGLEGMVTNVVLYPENVQKTTQMVAALRQQLGQQYEAMTWQEMTPDLVNMIETDRVEGYVFMFILYMVISFGIFGTMLMMLAERQREFGVLVAVGMKRIRLAVVVFLEVLIISVMGAFIGMMAAFPLSAYFHYNPIQLSEEMSEVTEEYGMEAVIQTSIAPDVFLEQAAVVALIAVVIAIYPFTRIMRMNVINAMRS